MRGFLIFKITYFTSIKNISTMDCMNWKIILGGSLIIVVVFFSFVAYQMFGNKKTDYSIQLDPQTRFYVQSELNEENEKIARSEVKSQNILIRGKVANYSQESNTVSLLMYQKQATGAYEAIGLVDVIIDPERVKNFLCWPEYFVTATEDKIDIMNAYFAFGEDSVLMMKGEKQHVISDVAQYLEKETSIFTVLNTTAQSDTELIQDTSELPAQYAAQLAILGCNEK